MSRIPLAIEQAYNKSLSVGIIMIGQYTNQRTKTQFQCPFCNNIFDAQPVEIWRKNVCSCGCYRKIKKGQDNKTLEFKQKISKPKFLKLGNSLAEKCPESLQCWNYNKNIKTPYEINYGSSYKYWFICPNGHPSYYMKTSTFSLRHGRCPICNEPKGERKIREILDKYKIIYESQKTWQECKDKYVLSFDFYLPYYDLLIEYQGEQHYNPHNNFGVNNKYFIQKKHDKIKYDFAICYHKFLEISYKDFSKIEEILVRELNLQNLLNC